MLLLFALGGCSGGPIIDLYASDYRVTEASAGDSQLLLNILRARDDIPIHFADLSVIHGSLQMTAGATGTFPIAHFTGSATPTSLAPSIGAQSVPTFDVGTLDTQDFTRGMLSQIDPKVIKQLFDQGVDPRIMMLLFFSEYQSSDKRRYLNNMACDLTNPGLHPEKGCLNQVYAYLDAIDRIFQAKGLTAEKRRKQLQANVYSALRPVGARLTGPWTVKDNLDALSKFDATKYKVIDNQVYSIEPRIAICYQEGYRLHPLFDEPGGRDACEKGEVIVHHTTRPTVALTTRSTYQIIQFLGQVLRFQEEKREAGENRCLTLSPQPRQCDVGEVLFQVNGPVGTPVIGTRYGGYWYAVYERPCSRNFEGSCDYSLQVLAILELLLNYNKAAKDIVSIPRVQVVP